MSQVLEEEAAEIAMGRWCRGEASRIRVRESWSFETSDLLMPAKFAREFLQDDGFWDWIAQRSGIQPLSGIEFLKQAHAAFQKLFSQETQKPAESRNVAAALLTQQGFWDWVDGKAPPARKNGNGQTAPATENIQQLVKETRPLDPRAKLWKNLFEKQHTWTESDRRVPSLVQLLNRLLREPDLHRQPMFMGPYPAIAGDVAEAIDAETWRSELDAVLSAAEDKVWEGDLAHLNRLLFELRFPQHFRRIHEERTRRAINQLHQLQPVGLCLSGGGIRSATFSLGVLQGLARNGLLNQFDYVSTVSGGGYIGSWLTSWAARERRRQQEALARSDIWEFEKGLDPDEETTGKQEPVKVGAGASAQGDVQPETESAAVIEAKLEAARTVIDTLGRGKAQNRYRQIHDPEPAEIRHLRSYSNYLTPKLGLLSADTWTIVATYLRNLVLTWTLLLPLIFGVLMIPRLWANAVHLAQVQHAGTKLTLPAAIASRLPLPLPEWTAWEWTFAFLTFWFGLSVIGYVGGTRPLPKPVSGADQPSAEMLRWQGQLRFLMFGLIPLILEAFSSGLLRAAGGKLPAGTENDTLWGLIVTFAAGNVLGWGLYFLRAKRARRPVRKGRMLAEFAGAVLTGSAAGALLWWAACAFYGDPVARWKEVPGTRADLGPEWFVVLGPAFYMSVFLLQTTFFVGIAGKRNDDDDREWWARAAAWLLIAAVVWLGLSSLVIFGPLAIISAPKIFGAIGGIAGVITLILGKSGSSPATQTQREQSGWKARIANYALAVAAPVFVMIVLALSSHLTGLALARMSSIRIPPAATVPAPSAAADVTITARARPDAAFRHQFTLDGVVQSEGQKGLDFATRKHFAAIRLVPAPRLWLAFLILVLISVIAAMVIDINRFSMHALYRNRLTRAYLGASNRARNPHPLTGFDPNDDLPMADLAGRPIHVVNTAMNVVKGENLAWQQRKAESFTMSPLHCGNARVGYRKSADYARGDGTRGISLGTAMAISGAAVSPNMGYHTSTAVSFLLTLFNVRLGWWLGNPGFAGQDTYDRHSPRFALRPVLGELLAATTSQHRWVYLSDGGHFENLGLYEMVRRRCHVVVVSDAGRDPDIAFEDLGNAIRKIRIDLGIQINIDERFIYPRAAQKAGKCYAVGTIEYSSVDPGAEPGTLIYLKPAIYGDEPADVYNYSRENLEFPHEPTGDQWFSESQFESYRRLGLYVIEEICKAEDVVSMERFITLVRDRVTDAKADVRTQLRNIADTVLRNLPVSARI